MGRGSAQVRIKLRNVKRGQTVERTFQAGAKFDDVRMERRPLQFVYADGDQYNFMDPETYETVTFDAAFVADAQKYLVENLKCEILYVQGKAATIQVPPTATKRTLAASLKLPRDPTSSLVAR